MELRNLRYFVALAEELSFTKAAQRLHISQPPLSVQIAQLEEEIGVPLFTRTSRSVQLTPAGEVFLNDTRSILDRLSVACDRARSVGSGLAGRIDIGLSGSQRRYFDLHAVLDVKHSQTWNQEALIPLVSEDPRRATAIAEGALMRLTCGKLCFERYRAKLWQNREL